MTQEKLEQRAKEFYINADESENENGMYQWMAVFARSELQKAAEIADRFDGLIQDDCGKVIAIAIRKLMD